MKRKLKILIPALLCTLYTSAQARYSGVALCAEPDQNPSGFFIGTQVNSPLFWGDLFSLGEKTRFGYGGGIFAGYKLGGWFSPEFSFDYGVGQIGPQDHQLIDYVSKSGVINYVQLDPSDIKLGELYSRTTYMQTGLRLQVGLISLLSPRKYHAFDVELAPAIYAQKFSPKLYTVADNKQWSEGTGGGDWNYAAGGDLGLRFRFSPKVSTHLRGGLLWLHNKSFDGLNNDPVWRVNLMANVSVGITFHFGKS
jgi:hypothetical protein